ncbi:MAG: DUF86 domain-containing protein [Methanosarcinales archaeon]|nr:DUF86 domain-containing protein [Methanosarcinales archaeon]
MQMDKERLQQYSAKIDYIVEKLYTVPDEIDLEDSLYVDGILYRVQTSIEAIMDIIAMHIHDSGISVSDDYNNIELIAKDIQLSADIVSNLKKLNGMRNVIVHRYGNVDAELVVCNLDTIKETISEFIDNIEDVLDG